jgi:hypothetical protein
MRVVHRGAQLAEEPLKLQDLAEALARWTQGARQTAGFWDVL